MNLLNAWMAKKQMTSETCLEDKYIKSHLGDRKRRVIKESPSFCGFTYISKTLHFWYIVIKIQKNPQAQTNVIHCRVHCRASSPFWTDVEHKVCWEKPPVISNILRADQSFCYDGLLEKCDINVLEENVRKLFKMYLKKTTQINNWKLFNF